MAQDATRRRRAAQELGKRMFPDGVTARLNLDDFAAAVGAIDDAMDRTSLDPARSIRQTLVAALPEPFRSNSTPAEKATVLVVWALEEVGAL